MKTLIKNGRVVTAVDDYRADIFIDGERDWRLFRRKAEMVCSDHPDHAAKAAGIGPLGSRTYDSGASS